MRIKELRVGQKSTWRTLVGITHSVLALKKMANSLGLLFSQIGQKMIFMSTLLQQIKAGGKGVTYPFYLIIRGVRAVVSGFLALLEYLMKKLKNLIERWGSKKKVESGVIFPKKMEPPKMASSSGYSKTKTPQDGIKRKRGRPRKNG